MKQSKKINHPSLLNVSASVMKQCILIVVLLINASAVKAQTPPSIIFYNHTCLDLYVDAQFRRTAGQSDCRDCSATGTVNGNSSLSFGTSSLSCTSGSFPGFFWAVKFTSVNNLWFYTASTGCPSLEDGYLCTTNSLPPTCTATWVSGTTCINPAHTQDMSLTCAPATITGVWTDLGGGNIQVDFY